MTDPAPETRPAGPTVRTARVIHATPEALFKAYTDVSAQKAWRGHTTRGSVTACETDARVGGRFHYGLQVSDLTERASGRFIEISAPSRLVFSWTWNGGAVAVEDAVVTLEFMDLKDGSTRAVVTGQHLPSTSVAPSQVALWSNVLQDLAIHVSGSD